jgi:hypothetical protein
VFDNKILLANSPNYIDNMSMMPEAERQALLYGSWDSFSGQVFTEWRNVPANYDNHKNTHVITPFEIPEHWRIYRGLDWGYAKPYSVGWYAATPDGKIYRILELYGCADPQKQPNTGTREEPREVAARIHEMEATHRWLKGKHIVGIADPAIYDRETGESIADIMERKPYYISFSKGDHTRIPGKMQFHYRLAFDIEGRPSFQVFSNCEQFIRTFPSLVYDDRNVEDINSKQEDHIYDECRYILMANPVAPPVAKPSAAIPQFDPLNMYKDNNQRKRVW